MDEVQNNPEKNRFECQIDNRTSVVVYLEKRWQDCIIAHRST